MNRRGGRRLIKVMGKRQEGMKHIRFVYDALLERYGPQGWWPVTPIGGCRGDLPLGPVYGISLKNDKQKLEVVFGSLLTQNTNWKNAEKAIIELHKKDLIDIDNILAIKHDELAGIVRSSGYFNQKAKKLKNLCQFLKATPLSKIAKMDVWDARRQLLGINGVGRETADSILLYALNMPIFVVDAYTRRIFCNLGFIKHDSDYDDIQSLFMANLEPDYRIFNEYHALIVEHAKQHYKNKAEYHLCPLYKKYGRHG